MVRKNLEAKLGNLTTLGINPAVHGSSPVLLLWEGSACRMNSSVQLSRSTEMTDGFEGGALPRVISSLEFGLISPQRWGLAVQY